MCECVGYWIDKSVVPGTLKVIQSPPLGAQGHVPEAPGLPLFQPARFLATAPLFFAPSRLMALHLLLANLIAQL